MEDEEQEEMEEMERTWVSMKALNASEASAWSAIMNKTLSTTHVDENIWNCGVSIILRIRVAIQFWGCLVTLFTGPCVISRRWYRWYTLSAAEAPRE